ncbi:MAG TPA: cytochrome c oxidase accessory protein CcoG [Chryseolinea sp.]
MDSNIKINVRKDRLQEHDGDEEFRDSIATVDEKGKRLWIYPKKPSGKYHSWRIAVTVVLLSLLFGGPFIQINGQPLLLINIFERRFVIFGQAFWPQDFVLLAVTLIAFFVFIILFTVVFGRVWCGWLCPQTLFMEMVFRKIEYWIEGDAAAQRRLAKEKWNTTKIFKKTLKHTIFILISILIAHTLMAYLIGVEQTLSIAAKPPSENIAGFLGLVSFTGIFYGLFAKFREQACIAVCPYGRLQGVLLGRESIVVAYDWIRGEPRGHLKKDQSAAAVGLGDCVDCKLCVHVCPTGIDIRNGTQLECVNCTACMDACDDVMIKIGRPKGLIRYASITSITKGAVNLITPRVIGYSLILIALVAVLGFALITRSDVEATILKVPGTLYQREADVITNLYNIEFVNKTFEELQIEIKIISPPFATIHKVDGRPITVPAEGIAKSVYFIKIPEENITHVRTVIKLGVYQNGKQIETVKAKFIGPVTKLPVQ